MKRTRTEQMSRAAGVVAASLLMVGGAAVSPAAADPPDVTMTRDAGITYVFPDPVNGYANRCEFPVMYQDDGKLVDIQFADGRYLGTAPGLHATVTNLDTGKSFDLRVNGSLRVSAPSPVGTQGHYSDVTTFIGPTINLSPGQLTWLTGRTVIATEYDQLDNIVSQTISHTGPTLDVCAALTP